MSESCNQSCNTCGDKECGERSFKVASNEGSDIKKVIGVVSGKGGVGKSTVTSMLAVAMQRRGYRTAVLDADITGPSIPKVFGVSGAVLQNSLGMMPMSSSGGTQIMSINLLLPEDTDPVIWRGPIVGNFVKQFWTDVAWGDVDYLFIDMPPGTGDVPLTVFQSIPVDGIIMVTSPQSLVSMIVSKAVKMAEMMHIPIIGLVENLSFFRCPDTGKDYFIFGDSHIDAIATAHDLPVLGRLPIDPEVSAACDAGRVESVNTQGLEGAIKAIEAL